MFFMADCKVFLCLEPVDMRKSYEGLGALVQTLLNHNPLSGHLFVFTNKKKDRLKILYWHSNGYCLWQKRLEKGKFYSPPLSSGVSYALTVYQLSGLFQGIDWLKIPIPQSLSYTYS